MFLLMNFIKVSEYRWKFHKSRRDNKNPCWNKTRAIIKSSQPWKGGKLGWPSRGFVQRGQLWKPEKYSRTFRIAGGPDCSCLQRKQFSFKHSGGIASISTEKNLLFLWIVLPGNQNKKQRQCDLPMIHFKFLWYMYFSWGQVSNSFITSLLRGTGIQKISFRGIFPISIMVQKEENIRKTKQNTHYLYILMFC